MSEPQQVWVVDFEATNESEAIWVGHQSVHASKPGAFSRLTGLLEAQGVDAFQIPDAIVIGSALAEDGSQTMELMTEVETYIEYGVHKMPVED